MDIWTSLFIMTAWQCLTPSMSQSTNTQTSIPDNSAAINNTADTKEVQSEQAVASLLSFGCVAAVASNQKRSQKMSYGEPQN